MLVCARIHALPIITQYVIYKCNKLAEVLGKKSEEHLSSIKNIMYVEKHFVNFCMVQDLSNNINFCMVMD
jgi:hypothetical protein